VILWFFLSLLRRFISTSDPVINFNQFSFQYSVWLFVTVGIALVVASSWEESDLPQDQVDQVLALYNKHCRSSYGRSSSPGPNVHVVCKEGREHHGPSRKQVIRVPPGPQPKQNILFVEAPTVKVKHDITLVGEEPKPQRTVIYVLPNKHHHNFNFLYKNSGVLNSPKPEVFFLGNKNSGGHVPPTGPVLSPSHPSRGYPEAESHPTPSPSDGYPASIPAPAEPSGGYYGPPSPHNQNFGGYSAPVNSSFGGGFSEKPSDKNLGFGRQIISAVRNQNQPQQQDHLQPSLPGLGPEYEIVAADPETVNKYYAHLQSGYSSAFSKHQNQFIGSIESSREEGLPLGTVIKSSSEKKEPEVLVQPLTPSLGSYSSYGRSGAQDIVSNHGIDNLRGRIIFPSESIQQYKYSNTESPFKEPPTSSSFTATEASTTQKSISHLPRSLFKRKLPNPKIRFPDDPSIIDPKFFLSYNDYYNYMGTPESEESSSVSNESNVSKKGKKKRKRVRGKSQSSNEASNENRSSEEISAEVENSPSSFSSINSRLSTSRRTSSPFHMKLLLALSSKAQTENTSTRQPKQQSQEQYFIEKITPRFSSKEQQPTYFSVKDSQAESYSRNRKRNDQPGFEMIPATLVSYSYTKSDSR
jgi:hypothetical protein